MIKYLVPVLLLGVSACAQQEVQSSIESFSSLGTAGGGKSIAILAANPKNTGTLEFKTYASKLAKKLSAHDYKVVGPSDNADYVAFFGYGIDDGTLVTSTYSIPQWGVTGYSGAATTGSLGVYGNTATYNSTTSYTPRYGVTGYSTGIETHTIYKRALLLDIYDSSKINRTKSNSIQDAQVYNGKLISAGGCSNVSAVFDTLLEALFQDFPGKSGSSRTVTMPMKDGKRC